MMIQEQNTENSTQIVNSSVYYKTLRTQQTIEQKYLSMILYRLYNPFFQISKVQLIHIFMEIAVADHLLILIAIFAKYV